MEQVESQLNQFTTLDEASGKFSENSRVWVYQADKDLNREEILDITKQVKRYAELWKVHGDKASAFGEFLFGKFIIFIVSEETPASGCSIDSSVQFVKQLGEKYAIDFFNRTNIAYINDATGEIELEDLVSVKEKISRGEIDLDTYFFNNTITTKGQLDGEWIRIFRDSWVV